MAIKSVRLDESSDECICCGNCEAICPEVFEVPDKMRVRSGVDFNAHEASVREAAAACPTEVIAID